MDLCDTIGLKQFNDGDTFISTITDVFSKIGFARSLKDKKGYTVLIAFRNVLKESGRKPACPHKSVGMSHIEVNDSNQLKIWKKYYSQGVNRKPFKFSIRDRVRISRDKGVFAKGYVQSWWEEHFVIELRLCSTPNVYVLGDLGGETLHCVFYEEQLQMVKAPDVFPISRIVRKLGKRALVEWRGWPEKFNSWTPLRDLQKNMKEFYVYLPSNTDFYMKIKHRDMWKIKHRDM